MPGLSKLLSLYDLFLRVNPLRNLGFDFFAAVDLAEPVATAMDAVGLQQLVDLDVFIVHIDCSFGHRLFKILHLIFQLDCLFHRAFKLFHDLYVLLANRLLDPLLVAVLFTGIIHHVAIDLD